LTSPPEMRGSEAEDV